MGSSSSVRWFGRGDTGSSTATWRLLMVMMFAVGVFATEVFATASHRRERGLIQAPANKEQPFGEWCLSRGTLLVGSRALLIRANGAVFPRLGMRERGCEAFLLCSLMRPVFRALFGR